MSGLSPILVAALAALVAAVGIALFRTGRRRRARRGPGLSATLEPLPAGLKHLASSVSNLSDMGIRLPAERREVVSRHRLGVLLGLR